jgi:hypothetical protein
LWRATSSVQPRPAASSPVHVNLFETVSSSI